MRIIFGKLYYRWKRYAAWYFGNKTYASNISKKKLPFRHASHQTPTMRKLKDVEMWLQKNKVHNLTLAIEKIDGLIINPGECFSYWKIIRKTGKRQGYKKGMILFYGKIRPNYGGGLCQLSNLIYWTGLHTALDITERHRHSYDVFPDSKRTQPFGSGATCAYNYMDLQITNNTENTYQLDLRIENDMLKGEWLADVEQHTRYEVYEKNHKITHTYFGAYLRQNEICRKSFDVNNTEIADEFIAANHALMMYQPFLEEKNPTTTS
jgi:vancomycin resistance protein VanW